MAHRWIARSLVAAGLAVLVPLAALAADLRLMMVEQAGCHWCAQWNRDIAPIYPRTEEGKAAPLLRVNLRDPLPDGVTLASPAVFTPTFILLENGREIGRIAGYPGEDFFWGLLGVLLEKAAPATAAAVAD